MIWHPLAWPALRRMRVSQQRPVPVDVISGLDDGSVGSVARFQRWFLSFHFPRFRSFRGGSTSRSNETMVRTDRLSRRAWPNTGHQHLLSIRSALKGQKVFPPDATQPNLPRSLALPEQCGGAITIDNYKKIKEEEQRRTTGGRKEETGHSVRTRCHKTPLKRPEEYELTASSSAVFHPLFPTSCCSRDAFLVIPNHVPARSPSFHGELLWPDREFARKPVSASGSR